MGGKPPLRPPPSRTLPRKGEGNGSGYAPSRRRLVLAGTGLIAALSGCASIAVGSRKHETAADDAALLNGALGLEYQALAAYDAVIAASGVGETEKALARQFAGDHEKHATALAAAVEGLGDTPVSAKPGTAYGFQPAEFAGRERLLQFLIGFEEGLAYAHLAGVPVFAERLFAKEAAGILAAEAMHWAVLRQALGEAPVPRPILG